LLFIPFHCRRASVPSSASPSCWPCGPGSHVVHRFFNPGNRRAHRCALIPIYLREIMKSKQPSRKQMMSSCEEIRPDDGMDPRTFFRKSGRKKTNRKALQMCGEIARTLSQVLAWESGDDLLRSLVVESVEPAPDSTRVLVTLCSTVSVAESEFGQILDRLQRARGRFRTEVATAIHRKRVPEIAFRVLGRGEVTS
jgi:ribosome-binding factor A